MSEKIRRYFRLIFIEYGIWSLLIMPIDRFFFYLFFRFYYSRVFKKYGHNVRWGRNGIRRLIPQTVRISAPHLIEIGDDCQFDEGVYLQAHHMGDGLIIGAGSRINAYTHIQAYSKIVIGDHALIAPYCHINSGNHGTERIGVPIMFQEYRRGGEIYLGRGSWMGRSSHVLGGASIGDFSVIAAGAVVTKKFPEYSKLAGVPARCIGTLH
ncbi:hypothetical protein EG832_00700 [bacterium]|nr:hypothetical protein [bacterium]